ncbi:MAG: DUF4292 domain-containing protein [Flavobacteriales bacterium]|nr:DUF4292 domain-containing protein [Flavobacteriales bacterium]
MKINSYIGLLLISFVFVVGCKAKKNGTEEVKMKNHSDQELIALLKASNLDCSLIKSKGNVEISYQNENYSLRGNIRIKKDSITWVSLAKASIPVMQSVITADSLKVLDKMGKRYYLNTIASINDLINTEIDHEILQDFFLGQAVAFDYDGEYNVSKEDHHYLISSERSKKIEKLVKKGKIKDEPILYRCWIEPKNFKCHKVIVNLLAQQTELTVVYANWEQIGEKWFPMNAALSVTTPTDSASLIIEYGKVECVEELDFPFNIPDSYEAFTVKDGEE